jgi:hypothetical protein
MLPTHPTQRFDPELMTTQTTPATDTTIADHSGWIGTTRGHDQRLDRGKVFDGG